MSLAVSISFTLEEMPARLAKDAVRKSGVRLLALFALRFIVFGPFYSERTGRMCFRFRLWGRASPIILIFGLFVGEAISLQKQVVA